MLESTALRALCCTELSGVNEVKEALEVWQEIKSDIDEANEVDKALMKIPWIRQLCDDETMPCALYAEGAVVWCKEIGWGSWPGVVRSVDKEKMVVDYSPTEYTEIDASEVKSRVRPFIEGFSLCFRDVTSLGNCSVDFEKSVDRTLQQLASRFPDDVIADHINSKVRGRWLLRMNKVSAGIDAYLGSFSRISEKVQKVLDKREADRIRAAELIEKRKIQLELKQRKAEEAAAAAAAAKASRYPSLATMEQTLKELWKNNLDNTAKRSRGNTEVPDELSRILVDISGRILRLQSQDRDADQLVDGVPINLQKQVASLFAVLKSGVPAEDTHIAVALKTRLPICILKLLLLSYMPSAIYRNRHGMTLVHIAAQCNNAEAIELICDHWKQYTQSALTFIQNREVDIITVTDNYKRSAMHVACEAGSLSCLTLLHQRGLNVDQRDKDGNTPLLWCASKNTSAECAFYLLNHCNADKNATDKKGRSTLFHAMISGLTALSKVLLQNGVWLNKTLLQTFVSDLSMGREPHRIIFDTRSMAECRLDYLNDEVLDQQCIADADQSSDDDSDQPSHKRVRTSHRVSSLVSNEVINQYSYEKRFWQPR